MSEILLVNVLVGHVKTDSMDREIGTRCGVVGMRGKCSEMGDHLGRYLGIEQLGLDTGYIVFGDDLWLVGFRVRRGIMVTDDDRANDGCRFLCALFGRGCCSDNENGKGATSL